MESLNKWRAPSALSPLVGSLVTALPLPTGKVWLREVKSFAQGHTARKWRSQELESANCGVCVFLSCTNLELVTHSKVGMATHAFNTNTLEAEGGILLKV